jgi:uncharacterized protein
MRRAPHRLSPAPPAAARRAPRHDPPRAGGFTTPALWQVRDADTTITLFGSVHTLPAGTRWLKPAITRELDAAGLLMLEAVIPDDDTPLMPMVLRLARGRDLLPLADRLPADRRAQLAAAIATLHPGPLDAYDTWYAALALGNADAARRGQDPRKGVESILTARARKRRIPVQGFETAEAQLTFFDTLPDPDQTRLLLSTLDDLPAADAKTKALVADWLAGRPDALAATLNREFTGAPVLRRLLLTDRNARWAAWIADRMKRPGRVFIAVGAGHLAGDDSVQQKLAAAGFVVVRK